VLTHRFLHFICNRRTIHFWRRRRRWW